MLIHQTLGVVMSSLVVDPQKVRAMIEALDSQGVNGKQEYLMLLLRRPKDWPPAPSLSDVMDLPTNEVQP